MLIYKNNPTLSQGGPDIGLKVGILAEIGNMLHECALSCADYRFNENFTSFLQDEQITYIFKDGQEEVLINGFSVEDYLSKNSSKPDARQV